MTERDRKPSGTEPPETERGGEGTLAGLKARLAAARSRDSARWGAGRDARGHGVGLAVRVGVELAGTIVVGVAIGWALDLWLGTGPWLLVAFFFLGAAAGVLNVYRAAKNIGLAPGYRRDDEEDKGGGA